MGDGEMDEPESLGAISLAAREKLDNLIFVVNCNLQRLDGPVRGNGKIIQELEAEFRGAGWNVIKVIWGSYWDPLIMRDTKGLLLKRMEEAVDGEYQTFKSEDGAFVRKHFFGKYPELLRNGLAHDRRRDLALEPRRPRSAQDLRRLRGRGEAPGQPTVILAKTIKGYGMGEAGEGQNITHQQKKMGTSIDQGVSATASACRCRTRSWRKCRSEAARRQRRDEVSAGNACRRWAGACRRAGARRQPLEVPPLSAFDAAAQRHRRARDLHHHGVRAHTEHHHPRQD